MIKNTNYYQTWDSINYVHNKQPIKIPILHIIGIVGSGKTHFIEKFFKNIPTFDIKHAYEEFGFSPHDLHQQPRKYAQFQSALQNKFGAFLKHIQHQKHPIALIESSGINQALNRILNQFNNYRIWIKHDLARIHSLNIYDHRPYAEELNNHLLSLRKNLKIIFNNEFDFKSLEFSNSLPPMLKEYLNPFKKKEEPKNINSKYDLYLQDQRYCCPNCGAHFANSKFLELHFSRSSSCLNITT